MSGGAPRDGAGRARDEQPWWRRGAVYHIYPRSFADSDGDGTGDLPGVTDRLDHLVELGVEALWLSPFYPSPMADFGYDVADHCDVDPRFGTLADFDRLVGQAHARGLRVMVDWVPNHTSDRHPWFRDPARESWYVWRDEPPNAWESKFSRAGSAWTRDPQSGRCYLHSFMPEQPDLDWDEPEVEAAMHEVLRFWLRRGVDGFRMDALACIAKDPALGDDEPGRRHSEDWPTIHPRLRRIRAVIDEFDDRLAVGELYLPTQPDLARYLAEGDQLHMAHNFFLLLGPWSAAFYRGVIDEWLTLLEPDAWPAWCLGNHDHPRIATRLGPGPARVAAMLLITLRGTPFIYQGDELGLRDAVVPEAQRTDIDDRDPQRAPLPWEPPSAAGPGAGFTTGTPWLPLPPDPERDNAASQARDPGSMLSLHRELLALRRAEPALRTGGQAWLEPGPDVLAYQRGEDLAVVLSFVDERRRATLEGRARVLVSTDPKRHRGEEVDLSRLQLAPHEGLLLRREPASAAAASSSSSIA